MVKNLKAWLSAAEKSGKGKDQNEEMRGRIVEVGTPLWQKDGRKRHLQFKAGKMYVIDNMVHPDPRKGYVRIDQDNRNVMHFCWLERDAVGVKEDDLTPEPYDSIFKRVVKCTTGRVYMLKIRSTSKTYFFWMQEPAAEKDSEICAEVNYLLNFPPVWMRFPQIACNLQVPGSPSQTSYDSAESNKQEEPIKAQINETAMMDNSPKFSKILREELPGLLETCKMEISRSIQTSEDIPPPELFPKFRDVSDIITPDSIRPIMKRADLMEELENLLPILEDGTRDSLENSVKSKSFDAEMRAFSDAVRNGGLGQILRNLGFNERSVAAARQGRWQTLANLLPIDDSDSEYADAVEKEDLASWIFKPVYGKGKTSGRGKPGPSMDNNSRNCNVREVESEMTKVTPTKSDAPPKHEVSEDEEDEAPSGSNENNYRELSSEKRESITEPKIHPDFNEQETGKSTSEDWESTTEPNFDLGQNSQDTMWSTMMVESENGTPAASSDQIEHEIDEKNVAMKKNLLSARFSKESPHDNTLLVDEGSSRDTKEHLTENIDLKYWISNPTYVKEKASVHGKPGPSSVHDRWNHNIAEIAAAPTETTEESDCGITDVTSTNGDKPPQHDRSEGGAIDVPPGSNGSNHPEKSTEKIEYTAAPNIHLDFNGHGKGTPENWESTTDPNFDVYLNGRDAIHSAAAVETNNDSVPEDNTSDENTLAIEKSLVRAICSMESPYENVSLVDWERLSPGISEKDDCNHSKASLGESISEPTSETDPTGRDTIHSTTTVETGNDTETANSNEADNNAAAMDKTCLHARCSVASSHESTLASMSMSSNLSSRETQNHISANMGTLQVAVGKEATLKTCSEVGDLTNNRDVVEKIDVRQTAGSTDRTGQTAETGQTAKLRDQFPSKLLFKEIAGNPSIRRPLVLDDVCQSEGVDASIGTDTVETKESSTSARTDDSKGVAVSAGTGTETKGSSTPRSDDLGQPGCSYVWVPPSSKARGCGAKGLGDQPLPSTSKGIFEQPGSSKGWNLRPFESHGLDSKSRETALSTLSSITTFLSSSGSAGVDEDDSTVKEMPNLSTLGTSIQENEDGETPENEEIVNGANESNAGEGLHENDGRLLDVESSTNEIAMIVLVPAISSDEISTDAKRPTNSISSRMNRSPKGSADQNQANEVTTSGSALSPIGGTATSSGRGPQGQKSANLSNDLPHTQKASNSVVHGKKNSGGKKSVAPNLSKSLEEVIYVSGPHKEVRYNLRKRPQVGPSLSGPTVNAGSDEGRVEGSGKRARTSSPGVPLPLPFRVPDASHVRSKRSRYPQVSRSTYLRSSPNQRDEGNDRTSRKRPNDDESPNSDAPPPKKARISDGNNSSRSKAGSSRQLEGRSSGGSGFTADQSVINKTSRGPIANESLSDGSSSADVSPRYNLRKRSAKTEDGQQTEPVRIREIKKAGPETTVRTRAVPRVPPGPPVNRVNRDRSQNTRPVIIEDKKRSKSRPNGQKPPDSDRRPKP